MAVGWTTGIRHAFLAPSFPSFLCTPVPGDGLALDVDSTHYHEKHSVTSNTAGRFLALITDSSSDRLSKRKRGAALTSLCSEACMRKNKWQYL